MVTAANGFARLQFRRVSFRRLRWSHARRYCAPCVRAVTGAASAQFATASLAWRVIECSCCQAAPYTVDAPHGASLRLRVIPLAPLRARPTHAMAEGDSHAIASIKRAPQWLYITPLFLTMLPIVRITLRYVCSPRGRRGGGAADAPADGRAACAAGGRQRPTMTC